MTTRLKLICHASAEAVRKWAFPADEPLDLQGRQKLAGLPHRAHHADRYLTSPALRAVQTAEAVKLAAKVDPMLRDCDYGSWTGRALDEVQEREPEDVAEWLRDARAAPHGGKSVLADRAVAAWLDAQIAMPGKIVAVTHASVSGRLWFMRSRRGHDPFGASMSPRFPSRGSAPTMAIGPWSRSPRWARRRSCHDWRMVG
jgi:broad specificity phosphatase PhoE